MHSNVCGPMQTQSLGGASYFLIFIDDCTRYTWVYFLRNKSEVFEYFKEFKTMVEKQIAHNVKFLDQIKEGNIHHKNLWNIVKIMTFLRNI